MTSNAPIKCAILDDYQQVALTVADWSSLKDRITIFSIKEHIKGEELINKIKDCEVVVIMRERTPFDATLLASLPNLKFLVTTGLRNASIDVNECNKRGIKISGTEGESSPTVELTWALILALARHIVPEHQAIKNQGWQHTLGTTLKGKRLGIIGLGKIGKQVSIIGKAFGMIVCAWSPNLSKVTTDELGITFINSKDELLETCDVVSVHVVLSERSRGMIGEKELKRMKPSSLLINTSRAAIIDQEALLETLRERRIAGVGLDVFEEEPLPQDSPFRQFPSDILLMSPHVGYVTLSNYELFFSQVVEDIHSWLSGSPIRLIS